MLIIFWAEKCFYIDIFTKIADNAGNAGNVSNQRNKPCKDVESY